MQFVHLYFYVKVRDTTPPTLNPRLTPVDVLHMIYFVRRNLVGRGTIPISFTNYGSIGIKFYMWDQVGSKITGYKIVVDVG